MKRARQAALALLVGGIAVVGGDSSGGAQAGAQASCTVSIAVANVHVASSSTYVVPGTLTHACGAISASWDMLQGAQLISSWFLWSGGSTPLSEGQSDKAYFYPSTEPLGTYQASPNSADDTNYDALPQNSYQFSIKVNSRISISGYRSAKNVYVRARVTQFNPNANFGLGSWTNSQGRSVDFYQNRSGWKRVGAKTTGKNGYTAYLKVLSPARRSYRATVSPTPTIWDQTSTAISR